MLLRSIKFILLLSYPLLCASLYSQEPPEGLRFEYRQTYTIRVMPVLYRLPRQSVFLKNVYEGIIIDHLRLIATAYIEHPSPVKIFYPEEGFYLNGLLLENPSAAAIERHSRKFGYFPLEVRKAEKLPLEIADPGYFFENYENLRTLDNETFYVFLTLEPLEEDNLKAGLYFYRGNRLLAMQSGSIDPENIQTEVALLSAPVRKILAGPEAGNLSIQTLQEGASVYIDGTFMGRTPLYLEFLPAGKKNLSLYKRGFKPLEQSIQVEANKTTSFGFSLEERWKGASLSIVSNQKEADVYVDLEYRGKTPLTVEGLQAGLHRVHIVKAGYIDSYKMIEVKEDESSQKVRLVMRPGNLKSPFTANPEVIGKATFRDLFNGTLIASGGFAITGLYFLMQTQNLQTKIASIKSNSGTTLSAHEQNIIQNTRTKIGNYTDYYTASFITTGVAIGISTYFFIRYVGSYDPRLASKQSVTYVASLTPDGGLFGLVTYRW